MSIERDVAPGVHRVGEHGVNWYVVEDEDGLAIVDAGVPRSWATLQRVLGELRRPRADVRALLLTHAHFDHVGMVRFVRARLRVPVSLHPADVPLARRPLVYAFDGRPPLTYPRLARNLARFAAGGALLTPPVGATEPLTPGAIVPVPGRPRVVHSPGHTNGHVALHLPDRGVLIAGDAIVLHDPYTDRAGPRLVARGATTDMATARASAQRLGELPDARVVLTGHGDPWRDGVALLAERALAAPVG